MVNPLDDFPNLQAFLKAGGHINLGDLTQAGFEPFRNNSQGIDEQVLSSETIGLVKALAGPDATRQARENGTMLALGVEMLSAIGIGETHIPYEQIVANAKSEFPATTSSVEEAPSIEPRKIETKEDLKQVLQDIIHGAEVPYDLTMEYGGKDVTIGITTDPATAQDLADSVNVAALAELLDEGQFAEFGIGRGSGVALTSFSNAITALQNGFKTPAEALQHIQEGFDIESQQNAAVAAQEAGITAEPIDQSLVGSPYEERMGDINQALADIEGGNGLARLDMLDALEADTSRSFSRDNPKDNLKEALLNNASVEELAPLVDQYENLLVERNETRENPKIGQAVFSEVEETKDATITVPLPERLQEVMEDQGYSFDVKSEDYRDIRDDVIQQHRQERETSKEEHGAIRDGSGDRLAHGAQTDQLTSVNASVGRHVSSAEIVAALVPEPKDLEAEKPLIRSPFANLPGVAEIANNPQNFASAEAGADVAAATVTTSQEHIKAQQEAAETALC